MKILVVEDNPMQRLFLTKSLNQLNYDIFEAINGNEALSILKNHNINIVICDWMMPGMDGIELCKQIRAWKNSGSYVYVIMVTSKSEEEDLMVGFEAGVDAYLQKPISTKRLNVQVKVGIRIINLEQQLTYEKQKVSRFAQEMETLAKHRAEQLVHADRMATLGVMAAGIAHEINNPATFINGNIQTFEKFWNIIKKRLLYTDTIDKSQNIDKDRLNQKRIIYKKENENNKQDSQIAFIIEEMPSLIEGIKNGTGRIQRILKGLKSYARQDTPQFIEYSIHKIIDDALLLCHNSLKYNVTIIKNFMENSPSVVCDPQQIEQVFINIFNNAADAMSSRNQGVLKITTYIDTFADKLADKIDRTSYCKDNNEITVVVDDNGTGFNKDSLNNIWNPFFTTKPVGKGTGLGMSISHGIIKSHGGTIFAENNPEGGARFIVKLPSVQQN